MEADVIVIGAGVAGLAAAGELARAGAHVLVLEARERIGGRVWSQNPAGWPGPVEMGAEFVHGTNPAFQAMLRRLGRKPAELTGGMWWSEGGEVSADTDFWERVAKLAAKIPRRDHGWSFQTFLEKMGPKVSAADRRQIGRYVSSFNAGPLSQISAHALRADHAGADNSDRKLPGRYDAVPETLRRAWPADRVELRLRRVVTRIRWRRGEVEVFSRAPRGAKATVHRAAAVIVTLPLGVLQAKTVRFQPALRRQAALIARLGWGDAARVTLRLCPEFWRDPRVPAALRARAGRDFGFLNIPGEKVPVWWVLRPPAPVLVGWAGGPLGSRLFRRSAAGVLRAACQSLARGLGVTEKMVRGWVLDWRFHNWRKDPFARGSYSFSAAGADDGPAKLAEPVADTVYFAGEATSEVLGTVHGALESGVRAARACLRNRRPPG